MTTLIYSGVALVTGYQFLYDPNGLMTKWLADVFPGMNKQWFTGFNAVLFTMTFACTSNHALFLRNAIRDVTVPRRSTVSVPSRQITRLNTLPPSTGSVKVRSSSAGLARSAPTHSPEITSDSPDAGVIVLIRLTVTRSIRVPFHLDKG